MKVLQTSIVIIYLAQVLFLNVVTAIRPVVHTKLGTIRGVEANDGDYNMFMSVPYGKVNLSNPFGAAIPIKKYDGLIEADKDSLSCIHMSEIFKSIIGKVDCLELNIYVPKVANETNLLPVMVYLFGGSFMLGTANRTYYGPRFLVRHKIILITIEFRNGPYGFMCLDTPEVPGNQGLKDQNLALEWIQENIKSFGGDPDKVTLSGQSSGSICAHLHYVYGPENSFDKVILASGTAYMENIFKQSNRTIPLKIAEAAGLKTNDLTKALDFIKNLDPTLLIRINHDLGIEYTPCVEKKFYNITNFINVYPDFNQINRIGMPILIGNTMNETKFFNNDLYDVKTYVQMYLAKGFVFEKDSFDEMSQLVESFYIINKNNKNDIEQSNMLFTSDYKYFHPTVKAVKKGLENNEKVFAYLFLYLGQRDYMKREKHKESNTTIHADELGYLFDMKLPFINHTYISDEDQLMIDRFTTIWANFVKFGDPTPQTSSLLPIKWKPVTEENFNCMVVDTKFSHIRRPLHTRTAFWELFYDINRKHKLGYKDTINED